MIFSPLFIVGLKSWQMYVNWCQTFKRLSTLTFSNFWEMHHSYAQLWFNQRRDLDDPTCLVFQDKEFSPSSSLSIPTNLAHCTTFSPEILCAKRHSITWHCVGVRWDLPGSWQMNAKFQAQHQVVSIVVCATFWCSAGPSPWCLGCGAQEHLAYMGRIF